MHAAFVANIRNLLRTGRGDNPAHDEARPPSVRAEALIAEFESSEKGWFWETTRDGTLSYISDSVARAMGREPVQLDLRLAHLGQVRREAAEAEEMAELIVHRPSGN